MHRVLIVEDDAVIADAIRQALLRWGLAAYVAEDFSNILGSVEQTSPHLVLMDISLPLYNGYYWCAKIRETSRVPVIFLSSRSDNMDIVMAVNMGGDDYIAKPVSMEVLTAKIQAMLRRTYDYETPNRLMIGGVALDAAGLCLVRGGERASLTRNEVRILQVLLSGKGDVVSREQLMLALWDSDEFVDDNTLTVNVNRLRKTLADFGLPDCIVTHKGKGYAIYE